MDTLFERYSDSMERLNFGHGSVSFSANQNLVNGFRANHESTTTSPLFVPTNLHRSSSDSFTYLSPSSEGVSGEFSDYNYPVIKYISDILLEEDLEGKPCMMQDCLALQAAEKSFYDVLNQKDPPSPNQPPLSEHLSLDNSDDDSPNGSNGLPFTAKIDWLSDYSGTSHVQSSLAESQLVSDSLSEMQSLRHFGGLGEASMFFPNEKLEIVDPKRFKLLPPGPDQWPPGTTMLTRTLDDDDYSATNKRKEKKHRQREDGAYLEEGRSNKQSAAFADDSEPQEMFDEVLLCHGHPEFEYSSSDESLKSEESTKLQRSKQSKGSKKNRSKKQDNQKELVDLSTLLIQCAQAVANFDQRNASELLKKIRQHSSPYGDATQRLAHYFANGLEARLAGAKTPSYSFLVGMQTSAADILKAYQVFVKSSPFKNMSNFLANRTIMKLSEKAAKLHIIDFGISYGFQWPCLIQNLADRLGGPPKLRITAIELPQPGFRPKERVEETARRLEKYAKRFNVPFECKVIAQKWETIRFDDLKIDRNELIVVNSMYRLRHIPDETVMVNSPRDIVLKLIKKINPDIFIHGVVNGTHNAPFFLTRFREALFHYSAQFDVFEATGIPREDEHRLMFEKAIYGRDIVNVIACEGLERVERPETYKQWQIRNLRAGFKQLPIDQELLKKARRLSKFMKYHDDFRIDEDGHWMLQGWKGRTLMALSFWKRA